MIPAVVLTRDICELDMVRDSDRFASISVWDLVVGPPVSGRVAARAKSLELFSLGLLRGSKSSFSFSDAGDATVVEVSEVDLSIDFSECAARYSVGHCQSSFSSGYCKTLLRVANRISCPIGASLIKSYMSRDEADTELNTQCCRAVEVDLPELQLYVKELACHGLQ